MKNNLILLTSEFPYGKSEAFLETELPYLANNFSKVIIIPTKKTTLTASRPVPKNCIIETSIVNKKNNESNITRLLSKLVLSFLFLFFYKELALLIPNRLNAKTLSRLLTYTRDAILARKTLNQLQSKEQLTVSGTLIYTYWCSGSTFGAVLTRLKYSVISRVHRGDLYEELYPEDYIPFRSETLSKIHSIYSISEDGVRYLSKKYPVFKGKFKLSRLGISIPETLPKASNLNTFVVVSCSSINQNKRVVSIAKYLKKIAVKESKKNIEWHHFGTGPKLEELQNQINKSPKNLTTNLHGHIENKILLDWYSKNFVHVFINLSKSEGIPVSIMEACSFGVPILATNVGGTSELVDNNSGWLINPDLEDSKILIALSQAMRDEPLRKNKSENARNKCSAFFDSDKNYPEFVEMIKSI